MYNSGADLEVFTICINIDRAIFSVLNQLDVLILHPFSAFCLCFLMDVLILRRM